MTEENLPSPSQVSLVSRTIGPAAHDWHANEDDASHHHGLVSANEVPYTVALYWESRRAGKTVHVGNYRINLRALTKAGYAEMKPGNKVRLRFVRSSDGTVMIQVNSSSPALPVGYAHF